MLLDAWDATDEVNTTPGRAGARDGGASGALLDTLARRRRLPPALGAELGEAARSLNAAVKSYAALSEHDTNASIEIVDLLGPGIGLVDRAVHA